MPTFLFFLGGGVVGVGGGAGDQRGDQGPHRRRGFTRGVAAKGECAGRGHGGRPHQTPGMYILYLPTYVPYVYVHVDGVLPLLWGFLACIRHDSAPMSNTPVQRCGILYSTEEEAKVCRSTLVTYMYSIPSPLGFPSTKTDRRTPQLLCMSLMTTAVALHILIDIYISHKPT